MGVILSVGPVAYKSTFKALSGWLCKIETACFKVSLLLLLPLQLVYSTVVIHNYIGI